MFIVSTSTADGAYVEARTRGTVLIAALSDLTTRLSDLDVPTFTVENIEVRYLPDAEAHDAGITEGGTANEPVIERDDLAGRGGEL